MQTISDGNYSVIKTLWAFLATRFDGDPRVRLTVSMDWESLTIEAGEELSVRVDTNDHRIVWIEWGHDATERFDDIERAFSFIRGFIISANL